MLRNIQSNIFAIIIFCFSSMVQAGIPTKIIGFQQIFKLEPTNSSSTLTMENVNPNLPIWVSLYYVGLKENDERDSFDQIALESHDIINSSNPNSAFKIKLMADELPNSQDFSLTEYGDVVDLVKDELNQTVSPVPTTPSLNEKKIRVYSSIIDFAQDGDNKGTIRLNIVNQQQQGLKPLAIYTIVGQGDKPEALSEITTSFVKLDGDGLPDSKGKAFGVIPPFARFMIFLLVAGALFFVHKKQ